MEEMESHLCCCVDKENKRELEDEEEVGEVIEEDQLDYASDKEYQTPLMGFSGSFALSKTFLLMLSTPPVPMVVV